MKNFRVANIFKTVSFALALSCVAVTSPAGVIDLLRGEPAKVEYQKVAFVGGATVKEVTGRAERLVGIDAWKPLKQGQYLSPGDIVRTGDGTVILRMSESRSYIKVTPKTIVRLTEIEQQWDRAALTGKETSNGYIVRSCRGNAFVQDAGSWTPVEVNSVLRQGAKLRTEPGALVDLYSTESRRSVRIQGSTIFNLAEAGFASRIRSEPHLADVRR